MDKLTESNLSKQGETTSRPFLKWAGGKSQLIAQIGSFLPKSLKENPEEWRYFEPMLGGGALFFNLVSTYSISKFFISDVNSELIIAYQVVKENVDKLIISLSKLQTTFLRLNDHDREEMFYKKRREFNLMRPLNLDHARDRIVKAALLIFLNRTCYNGLYRVNRAGEFNVPFGRYKNPLICDAENLQAASKSLTKTTIRCGEYNFFSDEISRGSFVYFDPPYRPISNSSSFTSYTDKAFGDLEQKKLAAYFRELDKKGALLMLSNSNPQNHGSRDRFFHDLYSGYKIHTIDARRNINSLPSGRGKISELLITNY